MNKIVSEGTVTIQWREVDPNGEPHCASQIVTYYVWLGAREVPYATRAYYALNSRAWYLPGTGVKIAARDKCITHYAVKPQNWPAGPLWSED